MKLLSPILLSLSILWFWLFTLRHLSLEWSVNSLYNYGWAVPILTIYLFWERKATRPPAQPKSSSDPLLSILFITCVIFILPLVIIQEANQDWIFISWLATAMAVFLTLAILKHYGGWPHLLHFGFPILFLFTAVPWPVVIENYILQKLMLINASVSAELLTITGNPAIAQGNIILVNNEYVNVDDACSGIRSLQTAFMMSLFLGEFYRIKPFNRIGLVISSFTVSFILNLIRTFILSYVGGTHGGDALIVWHDPLGYAVLGLTLFSLWAAAFLIKRRENNAGQKQAAKKKTDQSLQSILDQKPFPLSLSSFFLIWLVVSFTASHLWYSSREEKLVDAVDWKIKWPTQSPRYQVEEFSEITKTILKFNEGKSVSWTDYSDNIWTMYYLKWNEGRVSKNLASAHSPDICLPAAGFTLQSYIGMQTINMGSFEIPFRVYIFKDGQDDFFYTFHCIWDEKVFPGENPGETEPLSRSSRIEAVIKGKRNLGQRVLGISVRGPHTLDEALNQLSLMLHKNMDY